MSQIKFNISNKNLTYKIGIFHIFQMSNLVEYHAHLVRLHVRINDLKSFPFCFLLDNFFKFKTTKIYFKIILLFKIGLIFD